MSGRAHIRRRAEYEEGVSEQEEAVEMAEVDSGDSNPDDSAPDAHDYEDDDDEVEDEDDDGDDDPVSDISDGSPTVRPSLPPPTPLTRGDSDARGTAMRLTAGSISLARPVVRTAPSRDAAAAASSSPVAPASSLPATSRILVSPALSRVSRVVGVSPLVASGAAASPRSARPAKRQKQEHTTTTTTDASDKRARNSSSKTPEEDAVELICTVCFDLPPNEIYQCGNGHLLCKACHRAVLNEPKALCPTCRIRLSRERPSRNRIAEQVLSSRLVPCTHDRCDEQVRFGSLKHHLANVCGMRAAECEYRIVGCEWVGTAIEHEDHQNSCALGSHPSIQTILRHVQARAEAAEAEKKAIRHQSVVQTHLCKMLSKRCRDLCVRDVILQPDDTTMEAQICSRPFLACGLTWEVYLDPIDQSHPEVKIHLRVVSPIKKKTTIECFALAGPDCTVDLLPTLRRVIFRKRVIQSESFLLPFTAEESRAVRQAESVSLRIGFLDCSPGTVVPHFTTSPLAQTMVPQEESDLDDDEDDMSEADERAGNDVVGDDDDDDTFEVDTDSRAYMYLAEPAGMAQAFVPMPVPMSEAQQVNLQRFYHAQQQEYARQMGMQQQQQQQQPLRQQRQRQF